MDDVFAVIIAAWLGLTSVTSLYVWSTDLRKFDTLIEECKTTGHIQNTKTRIICAPEKPIDRN
jgi:hypothetical protein